MRSAMADIATQQAADPQDDASAPLYELIERMFFAYRDFVRRRPMPSIASISRRTRR